MYGRFSLSEAYSWSRLEGFLTLYFLLYSRLSSQEAWVRRSRHPNFRFNEASTFFAIMLGYYSVTCLHTPSFRFAYEQDCSLCIQTKIQIQISARGGMTRKNGSFQQFSGSIVSLVCIPTSYWYRVFSSSHDLHFWDPASLHQLQVIVAMPAPNKSFHVPRSMVI